MEEAWTALFEHMKKQPYYGECIRYGYNSQLYGKELTDYSKPELLAYREWLKNHYGTIENMQKAYPTGRVPASFDEVQLPTPQERLRADSCYFVNPTVDRANIDYYLFVNDQQAEAVCHFTSLIRIIPFLLKKVLCKTIFSVLFFREFTGEYYYDPFAWSFR